MAQSAEAEETIPYESHKDQKSWESFGSNFIFHHYHFDKHKALREALRILVEREKFQAAGCLVLSFSPYSYIDNGINDVAITVSQ